MLLLMDAASARAYSRDQRKAGKRIGIVPTMGFLHEGHLSLVKAARQQGVQFSASEDFGVYPTSLGADLRLLEKLRVSAVFLPESLYASASGARDAAAVSGTSELRAGDHETFVEAQLLQRPLCGASRPHFFRGVATVVTKLFNILDPDVAVFGSKDYQQLQVIRRLVRDLDYAIEIVGMPIVREKDGLAMSSRNALLSKEDRLRAPGIYKVLSGLANSGLTNTAASKIKYAQERIRETGAKIDYVEVVDASTLESLKPNEDVRQRPSLLAVAVFFGSVRLIDNILFRKNA